MHKNFVGAKRFSIEGVDTLVPMLQHTITLAGNEGIKNIQIGMAHRGSLELTSGWTSDVKYHLGGVKTTNSYGIEQRISLANNPSHLEIVAPVVAGKTRAAQDNTHQVGGPSTDFHKAMPIIIHGDAAYPGQGINFETMNLGSLKGYSTGGSLHIITNNRIGFTTEPFDGRSTTYSSDVAKGYDVPILHVNADDVEATIEAIEIAMEFRKEFHKDVVIDLVDEGIISEDEMNEVIDSVQKEMRTAHDKIDKNDKMNNPDMEKPESLQLPLQSDTKDFSFDHLKEINDAMLDYPKDFHVLKKLNKVLEKRREPFEKEGGLVDWAQAEQLAFATILQDGTSIRLTGQGEHLVIDMLCFMMKKMVIHSRHCIMYLNNRLLLIFIIRRYLKQL